MNNKQLLDLLVDIENKCFTYDKLSRKSFNYYLTKGKGYIMWAEYGYIIVQRRKDYLRIYSIAVPSEHKGKGIASGWVRNTIRQAYIEKKKYVKLECKEELRNFYIKLGFEEYGKKENYYEDGSTAIKFRRKLINA